jgi:hypothetical protein
MAGASATRESKGNSSDIVPINLERTDLARIVLSHFSMILSKRCVAKLHQLSLFASSVCSDSSPIGKEPGSSRLLRYASVLFKGRHSPAWYYKLRESCEDTVGNEGCPGFERFHVMKERETCLIPSNWYR